MNYIKNIDVLTAGKQEEKLRRSMLEIAEKTIHRCNPSVLTHEYVQLKGDRLFAKNKSYDLSKRQRVFVVGAGKATFPIAKALEDILGDRIYRGIVVAKYGEKDTLKKIELVMASHPIPDENSYLGARKIENLLKEVSADDIVIACFTGGSSSLFVSPATGISLEDKAETGKVLLTCGANIVEINNVRKHISRVKGGRLICRLPTGAHLLNLTVSDVIGDALDYITDPSVPDTSTFADAVATLDKYHLWDRLPESVTSYIRRAPLEDETKTLTDLEHLDMQHIVLLPADAACSAAFLEAQEMGFQPLLLSSFFEGESSVLGRNFVAVAKQIQLNGNPIKTPCCIIGGGETTVTIAKGFRGEGGPNQEFALSAARDMEGMSGVVVLGMDTDGTDGPTPYAGGLVDGATASKAREIGVNLEEAIFSHNTSQALKSLDDLVVSGNTGTNVNDLKIMIVTAPA